MGPLLPFASGLPRATIRCGPKSVTANQSKPNARPLGHLDSENTYGASAGGRVCRIEVSSNLGISDRSILPCPAPRVVPMAEHKCLPDPILIATRPRAKHRLPASISNPPPPGRPKTGACGIRAFSDQLDSSPGLAAVLGVNRLCLRVSSRHSTGRTHASGLFP